MKSIFLACLFLCLMTLTARSAQAQTETVLYNFCSQANCSDGALPAASLTFDGAGNLYGTTAYGGLGYGIVFELSPNGGESWNETVLYTFTGGADGAYPLHSYLIFDGMGNLYGLTNGGGIYGYGDVFEVSPAGASWTETVLYSFAGGTDGANPVNGLIMGSAGSLYGRTYGGGNGDGGTVFELTPSGGYWMEQVIYSAEGGATTGGLVMDATGNIFGTTYSTVFELSPNGQSGWNPTVLHTFIGGPKDGSDTLGAPALDSTGNVYGVTGYGGAKNYGTIYKLSRGKRGWTEKLLHSFKGGKKDGNGPLGVVLDADGNIYGTTVQGGTGNYGTVIELLAPVGKSGYKEKVLWSFKETDGANPYASLTLDSTGNLYGTTSGGGAYGGGAVFEVTP